jgi:hypothetical protein
MNEYEITCTCNYGYLTIKVNADTEDEAMESVQEILTQLDAGDFDCTITS